MDNNNKITKDYNIYNTRTDFAPKIHIFSYIPALYTKNMPSYTWLRYTPREPRWSDLMDTRTDC